MKDIFAVKRIIDGKTYNTETATRIMTSAAGSASEGQGDAWRQDSLYISRSGFYFIVRYKRGIDCVLEAETITPLSRDEARSWYRGGTDSNDADGWFGADVKDESGDANILIRLSPFLVHYINIHVSALGQSRNAWICSALEDQLRKESGHFFVREGERTTKGIVSYSDE